jgi:molybdate transport system substrate-binding protein
MLTARLTQFLGALTLVSALMFGTILSPVLAQTSPLPPLNVYAAVSLKNTMDRIAKDWTAQGHAVVLMNYGASSTLAQQIAAGAPADLFMSADLDWMDWLDARETIRSTQRRDLLGNELVLITRYDHPLSLTLEKGIDLSQALANGRLAIADPRIVPAGKYGKAALETLGLWDQVSNKLATAEHVRAVLNFVARGEAPLGIVYRTDMRADPLVRLVSVFPTGTHAPIIYPAAVIKQSVHPEAEAFLVYLSGQQARSQQDKQP